MIFLRTWSGIVRHWPDRRYEWLLGASAAAMCLALTIQPNLFALAPHYARLNAWADEHFFACLFGLVGGFRILALGINGSFSGFRFSPHLRALAAGLGAVTWAFLWWSFVRSYALDGTSFGPVVAYGTVLGAEVLNVRTASVAVGACSTGRR